MTYIYWSVHSTIHIKSFFTFLYLLNLFFLCSIYWISYFFYVLFTESPTWITFARSDSVFSVPLNVLHILPSVKEQCSAHSLAWTQPSTVRWPCCNRRRCHVIANCSAAALANIHTYVQLTEIRRPISWRLKARTGSPPWFHCIQSARSVSRQVPEKETQKQSLAIPDFCQHLIMGMFMLSNGHFVLSGLISICVWKWHIAAGNLSGKG